MHPKGTDKLVDYLAQLVLPISAAELLLQIRPSFTVLFTMPNLASCCACEAKQEPGQTYSIQAAWAMRRVLGQVR